MAVKPIKTVAILAGLILAGGLLSASLRAATSPNATPPAASEQAAKSTPAPQLPAERFGVNAQREFYYKMLLSILVVVVLGTAVIYVSKKLLPKISNLPGKQIRVVETNHLGQRKALHLIKIGSRQLLIGSTNESITMLADVTEKGQSFAAELEKRT
jgi:flagellar biosynthetic protein FliO